MSETISVWVGRDNKVWLPLIYNDDTPVRTGGVTKATFSFGDWCLSTENANDHISLIEKDFVIDEIDPTAETTILCVELQLGLVEGLEVGRYKDGYLTAFDSIATNGLKWGEKITVRVYEWKTCNS